MIEYPENKTKWKSTTKTSYERSLNTYLIVKRPIIRTRRVRF